MLVVSSHTNFKGNKMKTEIKNFSYVKSYGFANTNHLIEVTIVKTSGYFFWKKTAWNNIIACRELCEDWININTGEKIDHKKQLDQLVTAHIAKNYFNS
jgi:hypothetical protein